MPLIGLHLDPSEPSVLLGIWTAPSEPDSEPRCFYPEVSSAEVCARAALATKVASASWAEFFRYQTAKPPSDVWWETTEVDDDSDLEALFVVLSASVLASAAGLHGAVSDEGHVVTMLSEKAKHDLGVVAATSELDALADAHLAFVDSDSPFQRRARLLQSLWREERGLEPGPRESGKAELLGSRLVMPEARETLANYLTERIRQIVRSETIDPSRDREKLYGKPRIFNDLLSSQPLCFNLFGELKADLDLATAALRRTWPDRIDAVVAIEFEWSPGRRDPTYLGNRSAFDVYVLHTVPGGGGNGFIGIEVKYHENLRVKAAQHRPIYDRRAEQSAVFRAGATEALHRPPLQQIWLDHLLCLSMRHAGPDWKSSLFCFVYPELNQACADVVERYRAMLSDTSTFSDVTLERIVHDIQSVTSAAWIREFDRRYLDFSRIDSMLVGA